MPRILVADDHPLLLKGLVEELVSNKHHIVAEANNGMEALERILSKEPDIAILDVEMPLLTGIEVVKKAREEGSLTKFIILTSYKEEGLIYEAQQLGIDGYLLKEEPFSEIEKCIGEICKGATYFSNTFNRVLEAEINPQLQKLKLLSPSERTILRLVAQSKTSKEIAEQLVISIRTVQKHRTNIIQKLGLENYEDQLISWTQKYKELILAL
ncbi:response regulator [Zhouia amylolytica]|uniref:Two component LuxR family transcriptional regulator n=1 Tax=Zhouia amylolytica AD3 TaxID=1286632 RepID=W2ULK2_9FLAO|nr:response regulator transcription factor [Zhouia amylolytica]ETN94849.1 two component LuxR family transcriptional regulator [Zhouia amylolytica AD3]